MLQVQFVDSKCCNAKSLQQTILPSKNCVLCSRFDKLAGTVHEGDMLDMMNLERKSTLVAADAIAVSSPDLLEQYKAKVIGNMTVSRNSGASALFMNDGTANAKIVMDVLIGSAQSSIDIYCKMLHCEVFNVELLREKIDSNVAVRIVVDQPTATSDANSVLTKLLDQKDKFDLRTRGGELSGHVCIVDGEYVRYELDHDNRKALVSFNDSAISARMKSYFEDIVSSSEELRL